MNNFWPTLWSGLVIWGLYSLDVPTGILLAVSVGVIGGFFYAHNNWEEELCNCDEEDHEH